MKDKMLNEASQLFVCVYLTLSIAYIKGKTTRTFLNDKQSNGKNLS